VLIFLKDYLSQQKPRINEVNIYCGSYLPDWRPGPDFRNLYSAQAEQGGGVHLDLIHELDYCTWLFGLPDTMRALKTNHSSLHIDAKDYALFSLLYPGFTAGITLNYYRRDPKRQIEILTENGTLIADLLKGSITDLSNNQVIFRTSVRIEDTYLRQMEYFLEHIQNNQQPMNNADEAAAVLKLALYA
jgi:predicted dehydrogenase